MLQCAESEEEQAPPEGHQGCCVGPDPQEDSRPVSHPTARNRRLRELDVRDDVGEVEMQAR